MFLGGGWVQKDLGSNGFKKILDLTCMKMMKNVHVVGEHKLLRHCGFIVGMQRLYFFLSDVSLKSGHKYSLNIRHFIR